jgi:hypothetical protein
MNRRLGEVSFYGCTKIFFVQTKTQLWSVPKFRDVTHFIGIPLLIFYYALDCAIDRQTD